jgi:hypothetical protein
MCTGRPADVTVVLQPAHPHHHPSSSISTDRRYRSTSFQYQSWVEQHHLPEAEFWSTHLYLFHDVRSTRRTVRLHHLLNYYTFIIVTLWPAVWPAVWPVCPSHRVHQTNRTVHPPAHHPIRALVVVAVVYTHGPYTADTAYTVIVLVG